MKKIYLDAITLAAERCGLEPYSFTSEFADILAAEAYDYHDDSDADPADVDHGNNSPKHQTATN